MYKAKAIKYVVTRLPIDDKILETAYKEDEPIREHKEAPQPSMSKKILPPKEKEEDVIEAKVEDAA